MYLIIQFMMYTILNHQLYGHYIKSLSLSDQNSLLTSYDTA